MTERERRVAELAAQDLESWARELPLGSETRRDLQQTARAYRFAARVGAGGAALQAVPDTRAAEDATAGAGQVRSRLSGQAADGPTLTEAPRALRPPLDRGA